MFILGRIPVIVCSVYNFAFCFNRKNVRKTNVQTKDLFCDDFEVHPEIRYVFFLLFAFRQYCYGQDNDNATTRNAVDIVNCFKKIA